MYESGLGWPQDQSWESPDHWNELFGYQHPTSDLDFGSWNQQIMLQQENTRTSSASTNPHMLTPSEWLKNAGSADATRFASSVSHQQRRRRRRSNVSVFEPEQVPVETQEHVTVVDSSSYSNSGLIGLSTTARGTRLVQDLLNVASPAEMTDILVQFQSASTDEIIKMCTCEYGNFVAKLLVLKCTGDQIKFIADAISEYGVVELAKDNIASRIIQKLIDHHHSDNEDMIWQLLVEIPSLCTTAFGNYIVQSILESCGLRYQHAAIDQIIPHVVKYAQNRYASNVIEMILGKASDAQVAKILQITIDANSVLDIANNRYGKFVIARILKLSTDQNREYAPAKITIVEILRVNNVVITGA
jgi:hypothetical protein